MTSSISAFVELDQATKDERLVNEHAFALGFRSTRPLSPMRIIELCRLGDEMIRASTRRQHAADRVAKLR